MNEETSFPITSPSTPSPPTDEAPAAPLPPKGPTFAELGLRAEVLRAVEEMGFSEPMPVQTATLPLITAGSTTGATAAVIATNTIEVRHLSTDPGAEKFLSMAAPGGGQNGYAVLYV